MEHLVGKKTWVAIVSLVLLVALIAFAKIHYSGTAPVSLPAASCDSDLWKHVYEPERLKVIEPCTEVEGRVVSVRPADDGDLHIGLDPDRKSVLNLINVMHAGRRLVVEIVCDHPPDEKAPVSSCAGYTSAIAAPHVGDRVRITGAYVTERDNGWNEIHPVMRIEILGK